MYTLPLRLFVAGLLLSFFACQNIPDRPTDIAKGGDDPIPGDSSGYRLRLIRQLKRVRAMVIARDKHGLQRLCGFATPESLLYFYLHDSSDLTPEEKKMDRKILGEKLFNEYTEEKMKTPDYLRFEKLVTSFGDSELNKLRDLGRDSLEQDIVIEAEPCYTYHLITIEDSLITYIFGMDKNERYGSGKEDRGTCDHEYGWGFKFDGQRLDLRLISRMEPGHFKVASKSLRK